MLLLINNLLSESQYFLQILILYYLGTLYIVIMGLDLNGSDVVLKINTK